MLWTIIGILLLLWVLGFSMNVGGIIHLLLVVAVIVFLVNMFTGRRTAL
jgi:hypothetical protein